MPWNQDNHRYAKDASPFSTTFYDQKVTLAVDPPKELLLPNEKPNSAVRGPQPRASRGVT